MLVRIWEFIHMQHRATTRDRSVDTLLYPRQTMGNEFIPRSNDVCHILKCFRIFKSLAIPLIWPKSSYKHSRVTLYTAGHLHTAVPNCSHSRAPIVHTAVPRENNEHGCVYLRCRAVCKLPGCVEGHPWQCIIRSQRSGKEAGRRSDSPLWRHQLCSFLFISHADGGKRKIRVYTLRLLANQKRESACTVHGMSNDLEIYRIKRLVTFTQKRGVLSNLWAKYQSFWPKRLPLAILLLHIDQI